MAARFMRGDDRMKLAHFVNLACLLWLTGLVTSCASVTVNTIYGDQKVAAKPKHCQIDKFVDPARIQQAYTIMCTVNVRVERSLRQDHMEQVERRFHQACCKCGADAVIIQHQSTRPPSARVPGLTEMQGQAIRYIETSR